MPEHLRLCFISSRLPRHSLASDYGYLWTLAKRLTSLGHSVTILTKTSHGDLESTQVIDNITLHFVEVPLGSFEGHPLSEAFLDAFEHLSLETQFDLVHVVDEAGVAVALHKKSLKINLATDVSSIQLDQIFGILGLTEDTVASYLQTSFKVCIKFLKSFFGKNRKLLRLSDGIFVASQQEKDILELYYVISSKRIHLIPFGVSAKDLELEPAHYEPFSELGVPPGYKAILTVSPLNHAEEIKNLLSAFERTVVKKPDTALIIVGDGAKKFELEDHMLTLALASKVWFVGDLPPEKIDHLIHSCDFYVNLQSKSSSFEPTVLEAMAAQKTVIASEVGTSSNVISHGVDGFLVRPTEISSLTQLLLAMVSGQVDTVSIGQKAREKILKIFDTDRMVDETVAAYLKILKSTGKYK